jgi:hypothetical protein
MYGNAIAIKNFALLKNDTVTARIFGLNAANIKGELRRSLWNPESRHFVDRYKVTNQFVNYRDFIRGRELAGYVPRVYNRQGTCYGVG